MLSYMYENCGDVYVWYMGNKSPDLENRKIVSVQADGDELEVIREHFLGIPMCDSRVVQWTGEMAHFIVSNLRGNWDHKGKRLPSGWRNS